MATASSGAKGGAERRIISTYRARERGTKLSEVIARRIVRQIVTRKLKPGATLDSESVMLEELQVGRASLREALRILEVYGLIAIKAGPRGGPIVQEVTSEQFAETSTFYLQLRGATFMDLLEARLAIDPLAAGLAANDPPAELIAALERAIAETRAARDDGIWDRFFELSSQFHELLIGSSGNRILDLYSASLKQIYTRRLRPREYDEHSVDSVQAEHEAIASAIIAGKTTRAETLMRKHMSNFTDLTIKAVPGLLGDVIDWR